MIVELELSQKGKPLFHQLLKHVWKFAEVFVHIQGYKKLLILIALYGESIMQQ